MVACIEDTAIPVCMVGLLFALPNTQLTRRLKSEGRLHARMAVDATAVLAYCAQQRAACGSMPTGRSRCRPVRPTAFLIQFI